MKNHVVSSDSVARYEARIDCYVTDALRSGVRRFDDLLCMLPGIYPTEVTAALDRLSARTSLEWCDGNSRDTDPGRDGTHFFPRGVLPVPHPLDYDWRFSATATRLLLATASALSAQDSTLAVLGAPTVFAQAISDSLPRRFILFDTNPIATALLAPLAPPQSVFCMDLLRDDIPELGVPAVIADPPWYPEYVTGFLWSTRHLLRIGGYALLSLPPLGTRPGIEAERAATVAYACRLGLSLVRIEAGALPYLSPPFEQNALSAQGLNGIPLRHCQTITA